MPDISLLFFCSIALPATRYFFLGLAALAATSCAADHNPEPLPAPTARYHRSVAYLDVATPTRSDTEYVATKVAVSAEQTAGYLTVQLRLKGLRGEGLSFRVARAQLTAAMVGTYGYKTKLDRTPPTDFTYTVPVRLRRRRLEHVVGVLGLSVCAHRRVHPHGLRCPAPLAQRPLRRHMAQRPRPAGGEYGLPAPLGRHHTRRYIRQRPHSRCTITWSWLLIECIL